MTEKNSLVVTDGDDDDDDYNNDDKTIPIWIYNSELEPLRNLIKAHFCLICRIIF